MGDFTASHCDSGENSRGCGVACGNSLVVEDLEVDESGSHAGNKIYE